MQLLFDNVYKTKAVCAGFIVWRLAQSTLHFDIWLRRLSGELLRSLYGSDND